LGQRGGEKKNLDGQGGCSSAKHVERAHPQLVHWWLLVHSSREQGGANLESLSTQYVLTRGNTFTTMLIGWNAC
jgi:hypothetical protein